MGVDTLPKIPALAISGDVAEALLREMAGPSSPPDWKGLLDAPYTLGPGPARVRMTIRGKRVRASLRNVLATVPGADPLASPVIVGNHSDAWVYGAVDPSSGTAAVLETAAALARLGERGWKPSRPVVFAFFDGEEPGMLGSTRWLEERLASGDIPALAFVNVDSAVRANDLYASATPGLRGPLADVLGLVRDPALGQDARGDLRRARPAGLLQRRGAVPRLLRDTRRRAGLRPLVRELPHALRHRDVDEALRRPRLRRTATLSRILALYAGVLATPRLFPLRFGEIADFASRQIREIQARHPSSIGWMLADHPAAREPDRSFRSGGTRMGCPCACSGKARERTRAGSIGSSRSRSVHSPRRGPRSDGRAASGGLRPKTGCGAVALPALEEAVGRNDRAATAKEVGRLAAAFSRARDQLVMANRVAEGSRRPPRPTPGASGQAVTRRPSAAVALALAALAACEGRDPLARRATRLETLVDPVRMKRHVEALARVPHRAGSPAQRAVVETAAEFLRAAGLDVVDRGAHRENPGARRGFARGRGGVRPRLRSRRAGARRRSLLGGGAGRAAVLRVGPRRRRRRARRLREPRSARGLRRPCAGPASP